MDVASAKMIGAGLAVFALLGVGIGLGKIFSSLIDATARNPSAGKEAFKLGMIGAAFTESIALLAFVIAMIIMFK
jgi:F-type H+-transporting ATPase subunit c